MRLPNLQVFLCVWNHRSMLQHFVHYRIYLLWQINCRQSVQLPREPTMPRHRRRPDRGELQEQRVLNGVINLSIEQQALRLLLKATHFATVIIRLKREAQVDHEQIKKLEQEINLLCLQTLLLIRIAPHGT